MIPLKNIFFQAIVIMSISLNSLQANCSKTNHNTADYVIVGVGTAGGLLAKKLTDDNKTSVIALHSGQNFTDSFIIKYAKNTAFSVLSVLFGAPLPFDPSTLNLPPDVLAQFKNFSQVSEGAARPLYETGPSTPQTNAD